MACEAKDLHMLFFPFMAPGHVLPMVDMAKLFAARGTRVTILTTSANANIIRPSIDHSVHLHIIPFPSLDLELTSEGENQSFIISPDQHITFFKATSSLRQPFDCVLADLRPDCIITDMFLPWTYHVAAARGIPRLIFHSTSTFALCAVRAFQRSCQELDEVDSFLLLGLPHRIQMLKTQIHDFRKLAGTPMELLLDLFNEADEVESKSYGAVINSFYELEPEYADQYRDVVGRAWNVGPVSLCNTEQSNKLSRGGDLPASAIECLKWLEKKAAGSVVYMCFGSGSFFSGEQLREMALGLEASGHPFVWVVRSEGGDDWAPEGYAERIKGMGMVIRGWAPQLLILSHAAVGGFVTHCGWNSSLEGISAGLPMATWPLEAEQFYNEKLLVEILKVGVMVGSKVFSLNAEERPVIKADAVQAAVRRVMGAGEEAEERRRRAKELAEKARRAVEGGGSSYEEMGKLLQELVDQRKHP